MGNPEALQHVNTINTMGTLLGGTPNSLLKVTLPETNSKRP